MKKKMLLSAAVLMMAAVFISCSDPEPTAEIFAQIDGYVVTFNPTVENVTSYSWDFGDGSATAAEKNPVHTYESFGDYTVKLSVSGDGGEYLTTKVITIEATSIKDLLTGGKLATTGKTWVLDNTYTVGDGGGPIQNPPYTIAIPSIENVLTAFGLGDEYDNEYTFFFDGSYQVNPKNGKALAGAVYSYVNGIMSGDPAWEIGLCAANWTAPASGTWTYKTDSFTIDAISDPNDINNPPAHGNVTITGQDWIQISENSYFGVLDFPTTKMFVIDEISSNKMRVSMFVCGYSDNLDYVSLPSNMFHLTFRKK